MWCMGEVIVENKQIEKTGDRAENTFFSVQKIRRVLTGNIVKRVECCQAEKKNGEIINV